MIEVNLKQLIKYIVVYFPFGSESEGTLDSKVRNFNHKQQLIVISNNLTINNIE